MRCARRWRSAPRRPTVRPVCGPCRPRPRSGWPRPARTAAGRWSRTRRRAPTAASGAAPAWWCRPGCVGGDGLGDHVRGVGVPAAGHARRTALRHRSRRWRRCGGVDGHALGGVDGGGVAERQVLVRRSAAGSVDLSRRRGSTSGGPGRRRRRIASDAVALAVDRAAPVPRVPGQLPPFRRACTRSPTPAKVPCSPSGTRRSSSTRPSRTRSARSCGGQPGGLLVGVDDQDGGAAVEGVGQPGAGRRWPRPARPGHSPAAGRACGTRPARSRRGPAAAATPGLPTPGGTGGSRPAHGAQPPARWRRGPWRRRRRRRRAGGGHRPAAVSPSRPCRRRGSRPGRRCWPSPTRPPPPGPRRAAPTAGPRARRRRPRRGASWVVEPPRDVPRGQALAGEHVGGDLGGREPDHPRPVAGRWPPHRAGSCHAFASAPTTNDFPVPAGPTSVSTFTPEVRMPRTAAAWSAPSSIPDSANPSSNRSRPGPTARARRAIGRGGCQQPLGVDVRGGRVEPGAGRGTPTSRQPGAARRAAGRRRGAGHPAARPASSALAVSPSSSWATLSGSSVPRSSGSALLIARVRSGAVQAALVSWTSASAFSITSRVFHRCTPRPLARAARARRRRPGPGRRRPRRAAAASQRSSRCSTVSPSWDLARRVANVACRCNRSSSSEFGARPNLVSNAATSVWVLRVIARRREREQVHHGLVDPDDLAGLAVRARREPHPERAGQVLFHHPLADRRRPRRGSGAAPRTSSVRHWPSAPSTRFRTALWMCSCGSWSRESCWKNDATVQSCASTHRPAAPP